MRATRLLRLRKCYKLPWRASEYQSKICPKSLKLNMDQATWNNSQNCYLYQSKYGDLVQRVVLDLPLSQTPEIQISRGGHIRRARTPYTCRSRSSNFEDCTWEPRNKLCQCKVLCPPRGSDTPSGSHYSRNLNGSTKTSAASERHDLP